MVCAQREDGLAPREGGCPVARGCMPTLDREKQMRRESIMSNFPPPTL